MELSAKATKLLSLNPTRIATVMGIKFYEHPTYGDESPLLAIVNGKVKRTDFWETPETEDVADWLAGA